MCIGIPAQVVEVKDQKAKVKQGDHSHWVDTCLLEEIKVGDYLLTYQQAAINKISSGEAEEILSLMKGNNND